jgi:hypothetical protein
MIRYVTRISKNGVVYYIAVPSQLNADIEIGDTVLVRLKKQETDYPTSQIRENMENPPWSNSRGRARENRDSKYRRNSQKNRFEFKTEP